MAFRLSALRRADLLALDFELINLELSAASELVRIDSESPAFVIVHFPPQHLAEAVSAPDALQASPLRTALAGATRLVFRLHDSLQSVSSTLAALLDWRDWELVVAPAALASDAVIPNPPPQGREPNEGETSIEFPWRLFLSPDSAAAWHHNLEPFAIDDKVQVWRTYLSRSRNAAAQLGLFSVPYSADVRALASVAGAADWSAVTDKDRHEIVQLSSNYGIALPLGFGGSHYIPAPIHAQQFSLSTLGANGDLEGRWSFPRIPPDRLGDIERLELQQYKHIASQARDQFVRTVRAGVLCGTGHRASIVTTSERIQTHLQQVGTDAAGFPLIGGSAYLIQRKEVVVQEPELDYGLLAEAYVSEGREMPLRSIRLLTLSAEVLGDYENATDWLRDPNNEPVMFKAVGTDLAGNELEFELPLMFVPDSALVPLRIPVFVALFRNPDADIGTQAHRLELGNQTLAFATPTDDMPGSTSLQTAFVKYDIAVADIFDPAGGLKTDKLPRTYLPPFAPRIVGASAVVPAVVELTGEAQSLEFTFDDLYLTHGFSEARNAGQSFARFVNDVQLAFASQRGGGLASPSSVAKGISRTLGPIPDPVQLAANVIDLSAFESAKFFGTIKLTDLLPKTLPLDAASVGSAASRAPTPEQLEDPGFRLNAPRLTTRRLPGNTVEARFLWKPALETHNFGILTLELKGADLLLDARITRGLAGNGSASTLGRLRNAALTFLDAVRVNFREVLFRSESGKKLEFGASGVSMDFLGPLSFVNSLQSILPADGFDDPPFLTVDGQGVIVGYTLGVPSIGVGIFSLENIALSATLSVPFTERPAGLRFAVSDRHKPFLLSVSGFGGGGFFALAVSAKQLEQVEASLEFGGNISLNLVVASGGVFVMAGIYFGMTGSSVTVTGYLRCGGALEVLGLITISVEFYLAFTYRHKAGGGSEVWGQASLVVSIKIAFFSKSISLSVERRFAGSDGDPSFADSVTPSEWVEYLSAFAA
jgi:hypothetical protein